MTPSADLALIIAVLGAGFAAAGMADTRLFAVTPVVALMLAIASRTAVRARGRIPRFDALPPDLQELATATHATVDGDAARLLDAVLVQAAAIFSNRDASDDSRAPVAELARASCAVATQVSRLDTALESPPMRARNDGALASALATRELHARRLAEAAGTLAALLASGLTHRSAESERVAELATEIAEDASTRTAAWAEVDSLLHDSSR